MRIGDILRRFLRLPKPSRSTSRRETRPTLERLGDRRAPAGFSFGMASGLFDHPGFSRIDMNLGTFPRELRAGQQFGFMQSPFATLRFGWGFQDWLNQSSGEATHFDVRMLGEAESGEPLRLAVVARDASNMPVRDFAGTVQFESTDASATLPEDYTFIARDRGVHIFEVTPNATGEWTLTVTQSEEPPVGETPTDPAEPVMGTITVDVGEAPVVTQFGVGILGESFAGDTTNVRVTALTEEGRPVRGFTGTVHFESSDESISLPEDYTFTAEDRGSHLFEITAIDAGEVTITVTEVGGSEVPIPDEPVDEVPNPDEPVDEVPIPDQPVDEVPIPDEPVDEVPIPDQPVDEVPIPDEPVDEVPNPDEPVDEVPIPDEPVDELPIDEDPEAPIDEEPVDELPIDEEPVDELPIDEEPVDELPIDEDPEAPIDEEPVDELPIDEDPEAPIDEEPVDELPIDEDPEAPIDEEPVDELPIDEDPEAPIDELPVDEVPVVKPPVLPTRPEKGLALMLAVPEEPTVEEPTVEEPTVEEPTVEEPTVEEPTVEEPTVEEPTVEEPTIEEPTIEEPTIEEPTVDEPIAGVASGTVTFDVVEAPVVTHFDLRALPGAFVGDPTQLMVRALDASNRPVSNYSGTVELTSTDPSAILAADYEFTKADRGVLIVSTEFGTVGTQTVTATDAESDASGEIAIDVMDDLSAPIGFNFGWGW